MINNISIIALAILKYHDGTVYPHGKLIDKVSLLGFQWILYVKIGNVLWMIFAKYTLLPVNVLQQDLWQNEYTVFQQGVIVIPYIVYGHTPLDILQSIYALENVFHIGDVVLVFFYQNAHDLLF